jgi:hypothetical protein
MKRLSYYEQAVVIHCMNFTVIPIVVVLWMATIPNGWYLLSGQFAHDLPGELIAGWHVWFH